MQNLRSATRFLLPVWVIVAAGCDTIELPTETSSVTPPEPEPDFDAELVVQGNATSSLDGSVIVGASVVVSDYAPGSCDMWDIICSGSTVVVEEELTGDDGSFSLRFRYEPCREGKTLRIRSTAFGYAGAEDSVECRAGLQTTNFVLDPMPAIDLEVDSGTLVVGQVVRIGYDALAYAGLASLTVDWDDGSAPQDVPVSGTAQSGELTHVYEKPASPVIRISLDDAAGVGVKTLLPARITE